MPKARKRKRLTATEAYWRRMFRYLDSLPSIARRYETMTDADGMTIRVPLPQRFELHK